MTPTFPPSSNRRLLARREGEVHLVGTGPGDPGLLTLRALQLMQTADVVMYDRLVSDDILQLISHDALLVYVGKRSGYHHRTQDEINDLIFQFARRGSRVLRLKVSAGLRACAQPPDACMSIGHRVVGLPMPIHPPAHIATASAVLERWRGRLLKLATLVIFSLPSQPWLQHSPGTGPTVCRAATLTCSGGAARRWSSCAGVAWR
jgi:hypothetical protein